MYSDFKGMLDIVEKKTNNNTMLAWNEEIKKKAAVRNNVVYRKMNGTGYLKTFSGLESATNSLQTLEEVIFFFRVFFSFMEK